MVCDSGFHTGGHYQSLMDSANMMLPMVKDRRIPYAVALGWRGGKKGGSARAAAMTAEEQSESARKAVLARWAKAKLKKAS